MKFSTILMTIGFTALAAAQSTTTSGAAATPTLSVQQQCLNGCGDSDVNCKAACMGVPFPTEGDANATTECAAACDQGDGTQAATDSYASCVQGCIYSKFLTTTGSMATATATGSGSAAESTGSASSGSVPSGTGTESSESPTNAASSQTTGTGSAGTATSSGAAAAESTGAASGLAVGGSFAGLFAVAAGILVL